MDAERVGEHDVVQVGDEVVGADVDALPATVQLHDGSQDRAGSARERAGEPCPLRTDLRDPPAPRCRERGIEVIGVTGPAPSWSRLSRDLG